MAVPLLELKRLAYQASADAWKASQLAYDHAGHVQALAAHNAAVTAHTSTGTAGAPITDHTTQAAVHAAK